MQLINTVNPTIYLAIELGTQAAHRALALCRNGGTSRRCRNPPRERSSRVGQELSVAILPTTIRHAAATKRRNGLRAALVLVPGRLPVR